MTRPTHDIRGFDRQVYDPTRMAFDLHREVDLVSGPGAIELLPTICHVPRSAAVVDRFFVEHDQVQRTLSGIPGIGIIPVAGNEPTVDVVDEVAEQLVECDAIVSIGGGSTLDVAKLASCLAGGTGRAADMLGGSVAPVRTARVIAVPTTAGSGAEVTRTCVVTNEGRKSWAWSDGLRPDKVILDPRLTVDLPESLTVSSGLDAFVHAVEAHTSQRRTERASAAAAGAIASITSALPGVLIRPDDVEARGRMLEAACAAGVAIDECGTGIAHAIGHALASVVPIPHGLAVTLGLRATLEWNIEHEPTRYDLIAASMRPGAGATELPELVDELFEVCEFKRWLEPFTTNTINSDALSIEMAVTEVAPMIANNARPVAETDLNWVVSQVVSMWGVTR